MSDQPENVARPPLQEMGTEMRELRVEVSERFDSLNDGIDSLETRIDDDTVMLKMVAVLPHDHERRNNTLEIKAL